MAYSLNVPVPGAVSRLVASLAPSLAALERTRERHTLVVKRLGDRSPDELGHLEATLRRELRDVEPFQVRICRIGAFERPATGDRPVVYLAVEGSGLRRLHERLCRRFEPVPGLEGEDYVPHVTLGRAPDHATLERLVALEIEPVAWTLDELHLWDARYRLPVATIGL